MSGSSKIKQQRHEKELLDLTRQKGNDVCADCRQKAPRWASHLGCFVCVRCAGLHRKMGTHISKIKSISLDTWTREQVAVMKNVGNIRSNAYYNPNNMPSPSAFEDDGDRAMERYIRQKYEQKLWVDKSRPGLERADSTFSSHSVASPSPTTSSPMSANFPSASPASNRPQQTQQGQPAYRNDNGVPVTEFFSI